jgi:hypothetical protein
MKVLNLRCQNGHGFEGWFASEDDFLSQNGRGLVECPICADKVVTRLPSAPRLNLSGAKSSASEHQSDAAASGFATAPGESLEQAMQRHWLRAVRHVMANTEDVGERFANEARRIHYGEVPQRGIRGQTSEQEREALRDEGIEFASLPIPKGLNGPLQ